MAINITGVSSKTLLNRQDRKYKDIEGCRTAYELRYAIAYEAAIRNKDVKQALEKCIDDAECRLLKHKFGFTDDAILYYRLTHQYLFPVRSDKSEFSGGLSGIDNSEINYSDKPYLLLHRLNTPRFRQ